MLLEQMMRLLQDVALQNPNVVERVKLQHISRNLVRTANSPDVYNYGSPKATVSFNICRNATESTVWFDLKRK